MHVGAYITCARAHGGRTYRGLRTRDGVAVNAGRADGGTAGFVYPLARPCVISYGSILSTGTQFSRARCSFKFRFPAFARPSYTLDLSFSLTLVARSPRSRSHCLLFLRLIRAIHLSRPSRATPASVVPYTFRSSRSADRAERGEREREQ